MKNIFLTCFVIVLFTSCTVSKKNKNKQIKQEYKYLSQDGVDGKFIEPITLTTWLPKNDIVYYGKDTLESNLWTDTISEKLNIKLKYVLTYKNQNEYDNQVEQLILTNNLPELIPGISRKSFKKLASEDKLADLTDAYKKFSSPRLRLNVESYYNRYKKYNLTGSSKDNKIYGLSVPTPMILNFQIGYIRKNWLDRLGLKLPTNIDEFYKIMEEFVLKDPDGNGISDTSGLALGNNIFEGVSNSLLLFAANGSYPKSWIWKDGKVIYSATSNETKETLIKLNELYNKNVIPKEFPSLPSKNIDELIKKPKAGIILGNVIDEPKLYDDSFSDKSQIEWIPFTVPNTEGDGVAKNIINLNSLPIYAMAHTTRHPEAIVKLFNFVLDKQNDDNYAFIDIDEKKIEDKYYKAILDIKSYDYEYLNLPTIWSSIENNNTDNLDLKNKIIYDKLFEYKNKDTPFAKAYWNYLGPDGAVSKSISLLNNEMSVMDEFGGYYSDKETEILKDIEGRMEEVFTNIITGTVSIEQGWRQWITYWREMGGTELEKTVNEWYQHNR